MNFLDSCWLVVSVLVSSITHLLSHKVLVVDWGSRVHVTPSTPFLQFVAYAYPVELPRFLNSSLPMFRYDNRRRCIQVRSEVFERSPLTPPGISR